MSLNWTGDRIELKAINGIDFLAVYMYRGCLVYLIGETHDFDEMCDQCYRHEGCVTVDEFITTLADNTRSADIFVEETYTKNKRVRRKMTELLSPAIQFIDHHRGCLNPHMKHACDIPNIRMHYTDARHSEGGWDPLPHVLYWLLTNDEPLEESYQDWARAMARQPGGMLRAAWDVSDAVLMGGNLENLPYYTAAKGLERTRYMHKVQKQYDNIDIITRENVKQFVDEHFFEPLLLEFSSYGLTALIDTDTIYQLRTLWMDLYTLGRMHREFSRNQIQIVYTGENHSRVYEQYLLWSEAQFVSKAEGGKCLNVSKLMLPVA